jgi:hypothetical protein
VPFALGDQKWSYQQLGEWPPEMLFPLLRRAATRYHDQNYQTIMRKVPRIDLADRVNLLFPNEHKTMPEVSRHKE